jgi:hypothetical protein
MLTLHREHTFSDLFVAYLLARNIRYEENLIDQLFQSGSLASLGRKIFRSRAKHDCSCQHIGRNVRPGRAQNKVAAPR